MSKLKKILQSSVKHIGPSLKLAWKSAPNLCVGISVFTLASAVVPLLIAYVGKIIIDSIVAKNVDATLTWVLIEAGLMVLQSGVQRTLFSLQSLLGIRLGVDVNVLILEKAVTLELRHFEDSEIYDQLTRARREASVRPVAMVTDTLNLIQNALTFIGYVGLLFAFSFWAVLGLVLAAIPATISEMRFSTKAFRLRNWRSPDTRRLTYMEYVLATDEHVKEVKVLGLSPLFLGRYREIGDRFYQEDKSLAIRRSIWAYLLSLLATGTFYVCYAVMGIGAAVGRITLGNLTLYIMAFRQGQQAFQSCLTSIGNMYESNLYMSNLFEFLSIPTQTSNPPSPSGRGAGVREEGIHFEDVGFKYAGKDVWALRHISLTIPKGQSLALVGHNGAGKSTFIKLLCRLYDPTEGRILLDGKDLREWDIEILRKRIGVVFQDFNQYQLSFKENVGVGSVWHLEEQDRIVRAVERGGATEVLGSLPKGVETPLGRWFNDGVELSGGQWQKIGLSRGFMREESDILILDEPTAALDAEAEQAVFERFRHLTKGKTSILISHRFPTVRMADRIIVIEGGQILEEGTHESLVKLGGRYAHLFSLQAQGYL